MATIRKEIPIDAAPEDVWAAMRDYGAVHQKLAPGFVVDCKLEEGARVVTFANGMVARELLLDNDDETRRLAWCVIGGQLTHYSASAQVFADGDRAKVVWIADLLPNEMKGAISGMIDQGAMAMQKALARN